MQALSGAKPGQHMQTNWLGRLDIRVKVITLFTLSLALIFLKNIIGLTFLGSLTMICLLSLKKYRLMLVVYAILSLSWLCSLGFTWILGLFIESMQEQTLVQTLIPFLRMWPLINMALAISLSLEIGQALVSLKRMRLPRFIYLPVMVALRFIPGFINDIKQLRECLKLRGIPLNFIALVQHPSRTLRLMIVPMVIRALRLADELAIAAELKRVGYNRDLKISRSRFRWADSAFFVAAMLALTLAWNAPGVAVKSGMGPSIEQSAETTASVQGQTQ
jgi:energy-coupling factor transport system permease protein